MVFRLPAPGTCDAANDSFSDSDASFSCGMLPSKTKTNCIVTVRKLLMMCVID